MNVDLLPLTLVERRDGFVFLQPKPWGEKGTGDSYESIPPFGLCGRPRGPTSAGAATSIVLRDGPEGFVIATTDPRYEDLLPDTGEGGAGIYGCIEQSGSKTPHVVIFGAGGAAPEGTIRITCNTANGDTTVELNPTTGDVTITHRSGTKLVVKPDAVYLGDDAGAFPLVVEKGTIATWASAVVSALGTLGQTVPALAGYTAAKAKGI